VNLSLRRLLSWVTLPLTCEKVLDASEGLWGQAGNVPSGRDSIIRAMEMIRGLDHLS